MNDFYVSEWRKRGVSLDQIWERTTRSSGHGGQNVNKVSTAVQLEILGTGIRVFVSEERSQYQNRLRAWKLLLKKWDERLERARLEKISAQEKIRRQKRKRPRGLKEKILKSKKHRSEIKKNRGSAARYSA